LSQTPPFPFKYPRPTPQQPKVLSLLSLALTFREFSLFILFSSLFNGFLFHFDFRRETKKTKTKCFKGHHNNVVALIERIIALLLLTFGLPGFGPA